MKKISLDDNDGLDESEEAYRAMNKPGYLQRVNRDFNNFTDRRGVLGVALLLTDSIF